MAADHMFSRRLRASSAFAFAVSAIAVLSTSNSFAGKLTEDEKKSVGDNRQGAFEIGVNLGADLFQVGDSRQQLRNSFYGDLRVGYRPLRPVGIEAGLGFAPTSALTTGEGVFALNPHLDVNFDILQFHIRPYAGLGFGGMFFFGPSNVLHLEGHGQVGLKVSVYKDLAVRAEAKAMLYPSINPIATNAPFGYFINGIFTVGLMYSIGGEPYRIDRDGDNVFDEDDKCPDIPGDAAYDGCPAPQDTDGDGVLDDRDQCPDIPGVAEFNGCPPPDQDGDGVTDQADECPVEPGKPENKGCPERPLVKEEANQLRLEQARFETGKSDILPQYATVLDSLAVYLNKHPELRKLGVRGHTDIEGTRMRNQILSDERAQAVADYLAKKGVAKSRLKPEGFGQDKPIASNRTPEGRARNRRVEFVIVDRGEGAAEPVTPAAPPAPAPLPPPGASPAPLTPAATPAPLNPDQAVAPLRSEPPVAPPPPAPKPVPAVTAPAKTTAKPTEVKPTGPSATKVEPKVPEAKGTRQPLGGDEPTPTPPAKPEVKNEAKPEVKPVEKPTAKPVEKPAEAAKPAPEKGARQPLGADEPPPTPPAKPEAKPDTKPVEKPTAKPVEKPAEAAKPAPAKADKKAPAPSAPTPKPDRGPL